MKAPLFCLAALLLSCSALCADWQIMQKGQHKEKEETITISIRDSLVRYDRPARGLSWLTDVSTGDTILFMDNAKRYQRFTAAEVAATKEKVRENSTPEMKQESEKAKPVAGKGEVVAGWKTTQHLWKHPLGITMNLWVATTPEALKLGETLQKAEDANPLSSPMLPGTPRHGDFKGLIMRYEFSTSKGTSSKNAVFFIAEQKLEPKIFEVPADYKEMKKEGQ